MFTSVRAKEPDTGRITCRCRVPDADGTGNGAGAGTSGWGCCASRRRRDYVARVAAGRARGGGPRGHPGTAGASVCARRAPACPCSGTCAGDRAGFQRAGLGSRRCRDGCTVAPGGRPGSGRPHHDAVAVAEARFAGARASSTGTRDHKALSGSRGMRSDRCRAHRGRPDDHGARNYGAGAGQYADRGRTDRVVDGGGAGGHFCRCGDDHSARTSSADHCTRAGRRPRLHPGPHRVSVGRPAAAPLA